MNNLQEFYEKQDQYRKEMQEELLRAQEEMDDMGYTYCGEICFDYSEYWMKIESPPNALGIIKSHYFSCNNKDDLKKAISWVLNETKFYEVTAFVKGGAYVTFRSKEDIDMYYDSYYVN